MQSQSTIMVCYKDIKLLGNLLLYVTHKNVLEFWSIFLLSVVRVISSDCLTFQVYWRFETWNESNELQLRRVLT